MSTSSNPLFEIQKKILSATFSLNMAALKVEMPDIYEFYKNYTPKNVHLIFDKNGFLNLTNNDQLVYQGNPQLESNKQVEKFVSDPNHLRYQLSIDERKLYEHEKVMEQVIQKREESVGTVSKYRLKENEQIDFIAFMGSGLGYHLENLFENYSIRSALIFEPNPDVFYATLHNIDLQKLSNNCSSNGGKLTFKIGGNSAAFVNEVSSILGRQGYFNISHMYLYRHYLSEETTNAFKMVHDLAYRYVAGWGFCEDEVIGISHTITNISDNKAPTLLYSAKNNIRNTPVFIIGNGPSLDECLPYIKDNQDNAIIISSGTSLKPLLNFGIIPDIHVEQERPASTYKWIKKVGYADTLKKIPLLCLNTVYPLILDLFKRPYVMLKATDAGTTFIHDHISSKYEELYFCNPTVTNASAAGAIGMGFKKIFLFGLDYGYKSEEDHHSKGSLYYKDTDKFKLKSDFKVPGNFVKEVLTIRVFDRSRGMLELLLANNRNVTCINSSDGAKINHAEGCKVSQLPKFKKIKDKPRVVNDCLDKSFNNKYHVSKDLSVEFDRLMPVFNEYIKQLITFTENVTTRVDLVTAFTLQYQFVKNTEEEGAKKLFHRFFHGSINYLQATIMSNAYYYSEKAQQEEYIAYCLGVMNKHLQWLVDDLSKNYNQPAKA